MTYERLADFVQSRMKVSHLYQPVMLMILHLKITDDLERETE